MIKVNFRFKVQYILIVLALLPISCKNKLYDENIPVKKNDLTLKRLENDLLTLPLDENMNQSVSNLRNKYGIFLEYFSGNIINIGYTDNPVYQDYLKRFITDHTINEVYQEVKLKFGTFDNTLNELEKAFGRYSYFFPEKYIPEIITYISGFNHSIAVTDSSLGIGLDKYLGSDHDFYLQLGYDNYLRQKLNPKRIPYDCISAWAITEWPYQDENDNLINQMIYNGKIAFFTKYMFPDSPDSLIMGFTPEQMKFCRQNEKQMWVSLVDNKLLFANDMLTINKYIQDAPFTKGFTRESPGRAAVWIGWQIVEGYIKENREISLPELMKESDYQKILRESAYNP